MIYAIKDEYAQMFLASEPERAKMQIDNMIRAIGADDSLFVILFKFPEGLTKLDYAEPEDNFLQATGTPSGLTVELMKDGRLSTVGHRGGENGPFELSRQDGSTLDVQCNEVLSPSEVVDLFTEYFETQSIDTSAWSLRDLAYGEDTPSDIVPSTKSSAAITGEGTAAGAAGAATQRAEEQQKSDDGLRGTTQSP